MWDIAARRRCANVGNKRGCGLLFEIEVRAFEVPDRLPLHHLGIIIVPFGVPLEHVRNFGEELSSIREFKFCS
jgi:hypothetical protein